MRVAVLMSGSGTNAEKIIERSREPDAPYEVSVLASNRASSRAQTIANVYGMQKALTLLNIGRNFTNSDFENMARSHIDRAGIDLIALAGYDRILSPEFVEAYQGRIINVHPGDLRVRDEQGKPVYTGLGWEPSAKAILAGETEFYTCVHVVTQEVDAGQVLAVSDPVFARAIVGEFSRDELLTDGQTLRDVIRALRGLSHEEACEQSQLYAFAKQIQEELKIRGDWEIFPRTIEEIARGEK